MSRQGPPISNALVFAKVMSENKDLCRRVVERVLGQDVDDVEYLHIEDKITMVDARSVQLDVVLKTSGRVVNVEMQTYAEADLGRRMFMHHALMAVTQTPKGSGFTAKPDSYVIFICTFDPYGLGRGLYTFSTSCVECPGLVAGDGVTSMVYNATGDLSGLPGPVASLLEYFMTNNADAGDELTESLSRAVDEAIGSEGIDMGIATVEQEMADLYNDGLRVGRRQGLAEGRAAGVAEGRAEGRAEYAGIMERALEDGLTLEEAVSLLRDHDEPAFA